MEQARKAFETLDKVKLELEQAQLQNDDLEKAQQALKQKLESELDKERALHQKACKGFEEKASKQQAAIDELSSQMVACKEELELEKGRGKESSDKQVGCPSSNGLLEVRVQYAPT